MSNPNRPFGDTDPFDTNDPHQDARTDAPPSDADALDAWLNGIASHSGSPSTRSGSSQRRPDARIDDHDVTGEAASLIETAIRFHRRIDEAQSRDARAAEPDPQLWETIMERTSRPAPNSVSTARATANPWVAQPDTLHPAPTRAKRTSRPRRSHQQRIWSTLANLALVLAILLAGFGVWRLSDGLGLPPASNDNTPTVPGFAMKASPPAESPATNEPNEVIVPPVATPTTDCDFSEDIPIFNGVDESPWDGTAVLLTTAGDLVLGCPEEPEDVTLASGVTSVAPMNWPGTVYVSFDSEHSNGRGPGVINLLNGRSIEFGSTEGLRIGTEGDLRVPWIVGPAPNDPSDTQIVDLRTMETRLLSEVAGTHLPDHGGYLMSSSSDGNTLAIALQRHPHSTEGEASLITNGMPGGLLVVAGSLDRVTWISVPKDFDALVGFEVSPDGEHIALHGARGTMQERQHTFSIKHIIYNQQIARSASLSVGPQPAESIWTSSGLAYIDGSNLMLLPTDPRQPKGVVFEGDGPLSNLRSTTDSSVVLVDEQWSDDLATMVANDQAPTFYTVDIRMDEAAGVDATTLTGIDVSDNVAWAQYPHRFLVTLDPQLDQGGSITYQVVDATTGETIGTLDDVPLDDDGSPGYPHLGWRSVVSSADGETEVIAFDTQHIYLMRAGNGEPQVRQIASPPGVAGSWPAVASMFLSPDGTMLSLTAEGDESQTRWLLPLDGEPGEWLEVPKTVASEDSGYILFVPGTGA